MDRIAIAGATGYIGGRLAPMLLDSGYVLRCLVRSPRKLSGRDWASNPHVEIRQVDLAAGASLARELTGCSSAFYLVHSMMSAEGEYAQRDLQLARTFAESARAAGVGRIVYLGGLGETGPGLSEHLSSRRDVESALGSTGVPVTVLRAAMIIGSGSASFEILRYLVQRLPIMITPKWVSTRCQPIGVENVLGYLVGVLAVPECAGSTFDIGGSETLPYRQIMRVMAEELGLPRRWIIPVPVLTPRLSSYWIHLVTPLSSKIARPLAEGLKNEVICREDRITHLVPQHLLSVRDAIRAALSQVAARLVETNWSMAGPIPGDPDWSGGTVFRDQRQISIDTPGWAAFRAVCRLGGDHGWYADWLWVIRGWLDRLAGGPGLRRGRRNPDALRYGDALDFWRVVGLDRDRTLSLRAEMRLPGEALLDFQIQPEGEHHCVLRQTALFEPRGLFGLMYWYAVLPLHGIVFRGMLFAIRRDALRIAAVEQPD
ncbi:SDR family oxidoreductase [uncultured Paludibaculum sp.]|uniref:SDR family oxidoreductase n=1 Tax=uncultured Paludibaculum sp. TaxID=1765020 RepID=UPI002AABC424|nr:SDR family oxidoreductase [uncultured Paludibaculum sp.]